MATVTPPAAESLRSDPLLAWRSEFPSAERFTHLLNHSLGAMPRRARARTAEYLDTWDERNIHAWEEVWWSLPIEVGNVLADILHAPHGSVTLHPNATLAQATVLSALEFKGTRNRIVCTELDFPSMLYLYEGLADRGAQVVRVRSTDGVTVDPVRIVEAIDEKTAVVAISAIFFKTAALIDVAPVVARAHAVGAPVLLDAYQWIGAVPIDVTSLGVDFLAGGSVKYLCGGPGAGFLYVRPDLLAGLRPRLTGWFAHEDPLAFDPGPMRYRDDGLKLLSGTPHVVCLYAARAGYEIVREVGVEAIREKSMRLTTRIVEFALAEGWTLRSPREASKRGGSVTIDVPGGEEVRNELFRRDVLCDYRPGAGIRLGPHFYTSEDDVERALAEIKSIVAARR
ncbi:MAG: aminotransferase class V-fold PLP-dependent enzyme [Candidatus Eiseniibacteriota bacterium]